MIKKYIILLAVACVLMGCGNGNVSNPEVPTEGLSSWVKDLALAETTTQIVAVVAREGDAIVSLHTKGEKGIWSEIFSVEGKIGKKGIGKTKEGDKKTPYYL